MTTTTPRSEQSPAEVGTLSLALDLGQIRWKLAFTTGFGQAPRSCALGFSWTLDCERVLAGGVSR